MGQTSPAYTNTNYPGDSWPASNAIDGCESHTTTIPGVGRWWKADFDEEQLFYKIRIRNRVDCPGCGNRLAKTKVMISDQLCGSMPDVTVSGEWYEVNCYLRGNEIKLVTVQNTWLSISDIQAYAEKDVALVAFDKNKVSQSSDYNPNYPASKAVDRSTSFNHTKVGKE